MYSLSVDVPDARPFAALDDERLAADATKGADRRAHAAGKERARALHDLARPRRHRPKLPIDPDHGKRRALAAPGGRRRDHAHERRREIDVLDHVVEPHVDERAGRDARPRRRCTSRHRCRRPATRCAPASASSSTRSTSARTVRPRRASYRSAVISRCSSFSRSSRSRFTRSGTSSSISAARVPSCGEYVNAPTRSN